MPRVEERLRYWRKRAVDAEGKAERMRDALEKIANSPAWGAPDKWETTPAEVRQLARAALERT